MELALQLQSRDMDLELYWIPRLQNEEADALTNQCYAAFDPAKRCRFDIAGFKGLVLDKMLAAGLELYEGLKSAEWLKKACRHEKPPKQRRADELKVRDPWE